MSDDEDPMEKLIDKIRYGDLEPTALYEELEKAKVQTGGKWAIKHRYLDQEDYKPKLNQWYNERFETNRAHAEQLKKAKRWWEYVDAHPKDFYPTILEEIKEVAPGAEWCNAVRSAWYQSDVLWINRDAWLRIFSDRARITGVSTRAELDYFNSLKDPLTVYRGCLPEYVDGLSWSLKESSAADFARVARSRGAIFLGKVEKKHVLAYMNPNNEEFEVIVDPVHVTAKQNLG